MPQTLPRRLSRHHTLAMLVRSETAARRGIDNTPDAQLVPNLRLLARGLDRVRELLGHPLEISSGFRSPALNAAVGGTPGSQHTHGLAADFACPAFGPPIVVARAIVASEIVFDQLILEFGRWVHVSFTRTPRRRAMTIHSSAQGYLDGIVEPVGMASSAP